MRIRSGIIHILRSAAYTSGHVYMPKDVLIEHTVYTLKVTDDEVIAAVSELLSSKELFQDKVDGIDAYYLYSYYESEYYIARRLIAMSQNTQKFTMTEEKAEKAIDALEAKTNLYLAAEQRNAVVKAFGRFKAFNRTCRADRTRRKANEPSYGLRGKDNTPSFMHSTVF